MWSLCLPSIYKNSGHFVCLPSPLLIRDVLALLSKSNLLLGLLFAKSKSNIYFVLPILVCTMLLYFQPFSTSLCPNLPAGRKTVEAICCQNPNFIWIQCQLKPQTSNMSAFLSLLQNIIFRLKIPKWCFRPWKKHS